MGDRVLFQVISSRDRTFGPVVYGHWAGDRAVAVVDRLRDRMLERRPGDVDYTSARLVQELIGDNRDCLGYGIWNAHRVLTASDSHGDAGVVLIDVGGPDYPAWTVTYLGGYLAAP